MNFNPLKPIINPFCRLGTVAVPWNRNKPLNFLEIKVACDIRTWNKVNVASRVNWLCFSNQQRKYKVYFPPTSVLDKASIGPLKQGVSLDQSGSSTGICAVSVVDSGWYAAMKVSRSWISGDCIPKHLNLYNRGLVNAAENIYNMFSRF